MKAQFGKLVYKASLDGDITVEQQIEQANEDLLHNGAFTPKRKFEVSLRYDITRTVINILSNATIKYGGATTPICESFQKRLKDIFFKLHEYGFTWLKLDEQGRILSFNQNGGTIKIVDPAWEVTGYTQKMAARKALEMYGVVTDSMFSTIDERGMLGIFSPDKGIELKPGAKDKFYAAFKKMFGFGKGKSPIGLFEVPMNFQSVALPVKDLELLTNKKDATATVARIYGIQEDMILSGSTYDNKMNAIIQTYSDYKGLIYGWLNQFESGQTSLRNVEAYEITFSGIPQMNVEQNKTTPQLVIQSTPPQ